MHLKYTIAIKTETKLFLKIVLIFTDMFFIYLFVNLELSLKKNFIYLFTKDFLGWDCQAGFYLCECIYKDADTTCSKNENS